MTDMRISSAEAERMIVEAIKQGWRAARLYPDASQFHVNIEWKNKRLHRIPVVTVVISE